MVQRRILQVSACEYEPVCALCSSPAGLQVPGDVDLAQPMLWMEGKAMEPGSGPGAQGLELLICFLPLTSCATLGKSSNLPGSCFGLSKPLTTNPFPGGITQEPLVSALPKMVPCSVRGTDSSSCDSSAVWVCPGGVCGSSVNLGSSCAHPF